MAKRFTDTDMWDREWYMALPCRLKCLVKLIRDKADLSGVWSPNWIIASTYIGEPVNEQELLLIDNGGQFKKLPNGKIYCKGFIEFQYGKLSLMSRIHISVINSLKKHGIDNPIDFEIVDQSETVQAQRSRLTNNKKDEILASDKHQCQYCGESPGYENLVVDHIVSLSDGGNNEDENLTTACKKCNGKKWSKNVFEFIKENNISVLDSLSKKLDRLKDKYKYKDKEEEKEEDKEKETVKTFFNQMPLPADAGLIPDIKINSCIELLRITKQVTVSFEQVQKLWPVFLAQNCNGTKFYQNIEAIHSHFINWIKTQKFESSTKLTGTPRQNGQALARQRLREQGAALFNAAAREADNRA